MGWRNTLVQPCWESSPLKLMKTIGQHSAKVNYVHQNNEIQARLLRDLHCTVFILYGFSFFGYNAVNLQFFLHCTWPVPWHATQLMRYKTGIAQQCPTQGWNTSEKYCRLSPWLLVIFWPTVDCQQVTQYLCLGSLTQQRPLLLLSTLPAIFMENTLTNLR